MHCSGRALYHAVQGSEEAGEVGKTLAFSVIRIEIETGKIARLMYKKLTAASITITHGQQR